jgi:hypothetical protein
MLECFTRMIQIKSDYRLLISYSPELKNVKITGNMDDIISIVSILEEFKFFNIEIQKITLSNVKCLIPYDNYELVEKILYIVCEYNDTTYENRTLSIPTIKSKIGTFGNWK